MADQLVTLGDAAVKLREHYWYLQRTVAKRPDLFPFVVKVGRCVAVPASRLDDLKRGLETHREQTARRMARAVAVPAMSA